MKYKDKKVITLVVAIWLSNVILVVNLILGLFYIDFLKLVAVQFIIKFTAEFLFLKDVTDFAKRKSLIYNLTYLTFLHVIYFIYIGLIGNSGKYNWKGRMVK